ncbi:MAG TPA: hypothetical protein VGL93_10965 [Streptosporangiaceae bacterium]|jgi:hypothetical protein
MIRIRNGHHVVVCDSPTCPSSTGAGQAERDGWLLVGAAGPHYCPHTIAWQFHQLTRRAFGAPEP